MDETTADIIIKNQEKYGTDKGVLTKIKFIKIDKAKPRR